MYVCIYIHIYTHDIHTQELMYIALVRRIHQREMRLPSSPRNWCFSCCQTQPAVQSPVLRRSFPSQTVKFDPPSGPATLELEVNQVGRGGARYSQRFTENIGCLMTKVSTRVIEGEVYHWKIFLEIFAGETSPIL